MSEALLPAGFEALEPFVALWGQDTSQARLETRSSASMAEITKFYEAMTKRAEDALQLVERHPFGAFPEDVKRLYCLVLALAQAHIAVEIHGEPRAPNTPWPHGITITRGLPVLG